MGKAHDEINPFDPTRMFKEFRDSSVDAWAKTMSQLVHTEAYAESTGKMLDAWLTGSKPLRQMMESNMQQALSSLKLPSLDDVTRLGERLTNIEMRLDDLDAKLDEFLKQASSKRPAK
jgi:hypothetical protein